MIDLIGLVHQQECDLRAVIVVEVLFQKFIAPHNEDEVHVVFILTIIGFVYAEGVNTEMLEGSEIGIRALLYHCIGVKHNHFLQHLISFHC